MNNQPWAYQIFYRNANRHPGASQLYLLLVYDCEGYVIEAYEWEGFNPSDRPQYEKFLQERGLVRLIEMHVTPNCYNETKDSCSEYLQRVY